MDSDDEQEFAKAETQGWHSPPLRPYMRLKDDVFVELWKDKAYVAHMRCTRFFETVAGFYQGNLDLSGRHPLRFTSLMRRMGDFVKDFANVMKHTTEHIKPLTPIQRLLVTDGVDVVHYYYTTTPQQVADEFRRKWRFTDTSPTFDNIQRTIAKWANIFITGTAIFQKLVLLDLPPELVHQIMQLCGIEGARSLGACCKSLNAISQLYTFQTRSLLLKTVKIGLPGDQSQSHQQLLNLNAQKALKIALDEADFFLSRPDIVFSTRDLSVGSLWPASSLEETGISLEPILQKQIMATALCKQLVSLSLYHTNVTHSWLHIISSLSVLKTVNCSDPWVNLDAKLLIASKLVPNSLSVLSLVITGNTQDGWYLAAAFPKLKVLNMQNISGTSPTPLPEDEIRESCHIVTTLERLSLENLDNSDPFEVMLFCDWLRECIEQLPDRTLPLTHLNITTHRRMTNGFRDQILDALDGACLHKLMFRNVSTTNPTLINDIARRQPNLRSLVITRRPTEFNGQTRPNHWPHSTWDYARALGLFPHLKEFSWNEYYPIQIPMPIDLPFIEEDYRKMPHEWEQPQLPMYYEHDYGTPRLFAAYCPSLESLRYLDRGYWNFVSWTIKRHKTGTLEVIPERWDGEGDIGYIEDTGWPLVVS